MRHDDFARQYISTTSRDTSSRVTVTAINELIDQTSRAHLPSVLGVDVVMELTLDCGDVGDAVGDADDSVAADAADDGVAGVLAVAGVPALAVVTDVANVFALDAVAAVPRELAVAGVCGDVISATLGLGVLLDTGVVADVAVAPVADVIAADGADAADGVLGVDATTDADVAGVAGLAGVAAEPVEAEASTVPGLDAIEAVPTDIEAADVSRLETSVTPVETLKSVAGVALASCDDGLALDGPSDVVSENNHIHPL